jgi:NAD(P)-dependent dehydrogenase (short-subunit alcohol dehydrogenase family)
MVFHSACAYTEGSGLYGRKIFVSLRPGQWKVATLPRKRDLHRSPTSPQQKSHRRQRRTGFLQHRSLAPDHGGQRDRGVFFGIKYAIPAMVANGGGSIVNLSSIAGIIGSEHVHMAYNASKAAVRLMTKLVAVQHAKDKIRANSVHPGIMPPMRTSGRTADPAVRAERMRVIPMRRPGEVDEAAYTILFLASDESSYITGSEIHVDGGAIAI